MSALSGKLEWWSPRSFALIEDQQHGGCSRTYSLMHQVGLGGDEGISERVSSIGRAVQLLEAVRQL